MISLFHLSKVSELKEIKPLVPKGKKTKLIHPKGVYMTTFPYVMPWYYLLLSRNHEFNCISSDGDIDFTYQGMLQPETIADLFLYRIDLQEELIVDYRQWKEPFTWEHNWTPAKFRRIRLERAILHINNADSIMNGSIPEIMVKDKCLPCTPFMRFHVDTNTKEVKQTLI